LTSHARTPVALVIFDCDGVLIDSEPIANRVLAEQLQAIGLALTPREVMAEFVGLTRDGCLELAARRLGRPLPEGFAARWDEALFAALAAEVRAVDGVAELLQRLRVPWCVASNGTPHRMRMSLEAAGLLPLVEGRLFTASEVPRPKPAPDLFLHAAARMGAQPARCAVIEDTPTGVRAGVAAGMRVLAYAAAPHAQREALADEGAELFHAMAEVPALLGIA
jgi:HAD superfamily hydrolase (TIGR01509 family)